MLPLSLPGSVGLRRGTVRLHDHDSAWLDAGADACELLAQTCGPMLGAVQHVGSTAVSGLAAKPILDLVGRIRSSSDLPTVVGQLAVIGLRDHGEPVAPHQQLFVLDVAPDVRALHLHIVSLEDRTWESYVRFRDILRHDTDVRSRYLALKRELALRFDRDRAAYTAGKTAYIEDVLQQFP